MLVFYVRPEPLESGAIDTDKGFKKAQNDIMVTGIKG